MENTKIFLNFLFTFIFFSKPQTAPSSLSTQTGEVGGDVIPGLEGVTAELDMRRHT
jgi:hypothetical protein